MLPAFSKQIKYGLLSVKISKIPPMLKSDCQEKQYVKTMVRNLLRHNRAETLAQGL
jgi:hypothetical protein